MRDIFIDGVFQENHDLDGYDIIRELPIEMGATYLAKILYKYDFEDDWSCSYEVFSMDENEDVTWMNDWYEGQQHIKIEGLVIIDDIPDSCLVKCNKSMDIREKR